MATLSEERTDVPRQSGSRAVGHPGVGAALDNSLLLPRHGVGVRTLLVFAVVATLSLGAFATGAGLLAANTDDCYVISGAEYGGVVVVPGCSEPVSSQPVASAGALGGSSAAGLNGSPAVTSSHLWVTMPRLVLDLVGGLLG